MSFVDWIGFSKSLRNLNQKIKNNRLKQEQLTGNVSIFEIRINIEILVF